MRPSRTCRVARFLLLVGMSLSPSGTITALALSSRLLATLAFAVSLIGSMVLIGAGAYVHTYCEDHGSPRRRPAKRRKG